MSAIGPRKYKKGACPGAAFRTGRQIRITVPNIDMRWL
ncbi:hypothetical protein ABI_39700 [Asticcacaulis biprosthecium C19]|uniref:Uncharacterized protein n=1 Tax=Asticcacaulis biprosthecium C19 TaxID=715226 RepID=F4QS34_9CAUL|nr:hypothetical protein ABI_39700 [Asticcacaulis biprosthecium C19]